MFTAINFQNIRLKCAGDLDGLLHKLNIKPDWQSADEYRLYSDLDEKIERAVCEKLQEKTLIRGYTKILDYGEIAYAPSDTYDELIQKIVDHREAILEGHKKKPDKEVIQSLPAQSANQVVMPPRNDAPMIISGVICLAVSIISYITNFFSGVLLNMVIFLLGIILIFLDVRRKQHRTITRVSTRPLPPLVLTAVNMNALSAAALTDTLDILGLIHQIKECSRV